MISKILNSIKDFEECILDGTLKVCFLHENSKISKKGWAGFVKPEELYLVENAENNLGISLVGSEYPGSHILTCIDIDGDKREINGESIEQLSKDWAYKIITAKLNELEIDYMAVRSSSGGYHIYVYTLSESLRYSSTSGLYYPNSAKDAGYTMDISMFLDANSRVLEGVYGDELPKGIVEIWCQKRYMVAPGSDIFDDDGKYVGTTKLLDDGVQEFKKIGVIEGSLNDIVRDAFLEAGFKQNLNLKYTSNKNFDPNNKSLSNSLKDSDIKTIGDMILEYYPHISGQKHTCTLALGGYLHRKGICYESVLDLALYVVDNAPEDLFKSDDEFVKTLTHDVLEDDTSRSQTGLPTVEEILSPFCEKETIGKKLHLATNPIFHKFWPDGRYARKYNEIIINYAQHYIVKNVIQTKTNNDGEIIGTPVQNFKINHSVDKIQIINDISDVEDIPRWEKPVKLFFSGSDIDKNQTRIYDNSDELFKEYRKLPGAYIDQAKSIIESIYKEFEATGIIEELEFSTRPGIWLSEDKTKLRKFIDNNGKIEEITPQLPALKYLKSSLHLLQQINDVYPWHKGKFGFFVRMGLTMPYTDVLKNHFGRHHPSLILHGEAGTLKSTASELLIYLNLDKINEETDVVGGGELSSEYRFGRIMDISSFPLVVNETEYLFSNSVTRELIKDAVNGKLIRKPGGNNPRAYYSHRAAIYTMNTLPAAAEDPAYLRRFVNIEFDRNERGDTPEMKKALSFLNTNGINNARFRELGCIGDFVFYFLNNNIDLLTNPVEIIQSKIIDAMEEYTGMNLDFLKEDVKNFAYTDRVEQENNTLTMILKVLRRPYLRHKGKYLQNGSDVAIVKNMVESLSEYYYIHLTPNEDILIDIGLKNRFNDEYYKEGKTITLKGCYNYLTDLDLGIDSLVLTSTRVIGRKKPLRGIKMTLEDFTKILTNKKDIS